MSEYDPFAPDYDVWAAHMTADVAWYIELARRASGPFRSLLHLPTWEDKRRVLERVAAALKAGGRFAWNAFVFSPFIAASNDHRKRFLDGTEHWELVRHAPGDKRVDIVRGRGEETTGTLRLWWSTRSERKGLLEAAGLETEELSGGYDREPFDDESPEFVWVARKPTGRTLDRARQGAEAPALPAPERD